MYLMPYVLVDDFLISKYSRYLVFGLLAMALSLSWGYGGILNLGQALPFGLGSYCMAMALKLRTIPVQLAPEACRTSWSGTMSSSCPGSGRHSIR